MRAAVSILMAALLGIHALCGCCRHALVLRESTPSASQLTEQSQCCRHCRGTEQNQQGPQTPCKHTIVCQGVCTYLPSEDNSLDSPELAVPFDSVAVVTALSDMPHRVAAAPWEISRGSTATGSSLRLHLLHQVLLI